MQKHAELPERWIKKMMLMIPWEAIYFARSRLTEAFICAITLSQPFPVFRTVNSSAMAAYTDVCTELTSACYFSFYNRGKLVSSKHGFDI